MPSPAGWPQERSHEIAILDPPALSGPNEGVVVLPHVLGQAGWGWRLGHASAQNRGGSSPGRTGQIAVSPATVTAMLVHTCRDWRRVTRWRRVKPSRIPTWPSIDMSSVYQRPSSTNRSAIPGAFPKSTKVRVVGNQAFARPFIEHPLQVVVHCCTSLP